MTSSRCIPIALIMTVIVLFAAAQTGPPRETDLAVGSAVVTEVKGEVAVTSAEGSPVTAQRGTTLPPESRITTAKGSVLLQLVDGSQVLVKAHSNVVLRAPNVGRGYFLELFIGEIMVKVQKRFGTAPSFRMGTPSAVITVRGTRFEVVVTKKQKTYVDVFEGMVEVAGLLEGSPHRFIRPGFSTGVEQNRSPEEPREMNPGGANEREGGDLQSPGRGNTDDQRNQPRQAPTQSGQEKPD